MIIYIDIDNTICKTNGTDYANSIPYFKKIALINELYEKCYKIVYWTARGSGSGKDYYDLTEQQLNKWGVKYHQLLMGKPVYDLFIDDKTINKISKKLLNGKTTQNQKP